jgi:hypothetical protein
MFARPLAMLDQHCTWHTQGMPEADSTGASGRGRDAGGAGAGALAVLASAPASLVQRVLSISEAALFVHLTRDKYHFSAIFFPTQLACRGAGVKWAEIRLKSGQVEFT